MVSNIIAILSIIAILAFAFIKKQLTVAATIAAFIVGVTLYFCGGWTFLACLYTFFISSTVVSSVKKSYKKKQISGIHHKSGQRDIVQVLANSLIAVILAFLYYFTKNDIYYISVFIAFACFNADTWASELGIISKKDNIYMIGFKKVQKGISGAVTIFGLICSLCGSLLVALIYMFIYVDIKIVLIITLFGFIGSFFDSIMGQLFQVLYFDKELNKFTEKKHNGKTENEKIKGYEIINNDVVNFIAPIISVSLYIIIRTCIG